jgi:hypothetical protein
MNWDAVMALAECAGYKLCLEGPIPRAVVLLTGDNTLRRRSYVKPDRCVAVALELIEQANKERHELG